MIKRITNKCTNEKYEINKSKIQNKIEQKLYSELKYFFKDNLKDIQYFVSNNVFCKIELIQNHFEFSVTDNISFCLNLSKLESDISNNCCDGIQVFFNNNDLQINNIYLYDKIINSKMFKYYYYIIYSVLEGIKYRTARILETYENENYELEEENENYININDDFINETWNSSISFIIE